MPIDTTVPESPGWWLDRLLKRLNEAAPHYQGLDDYYRCTHAIPVPATKAVRESYQRLMRMARTNYAELAVEAVAERMKPTGCRTGADDDDLGDAEAWRIWQANSLDADCGLVHRAMLTMGMAYVIVGGVDPDTGVPLITPEDPRQVVAECDPAHRRKVRAAVKVWRDDIAGRDRVYLYLPGWVWKASRDSSSVNTKTITEATGLEWEGEPEATGISRVPVVPFPNRPDMFGSPAGEFENALSVLNRIDYTVLTRVEVATLQAYRQRAIKNVPLKDAQGNDIDYDDIFSGDPGAMWQLPDSAEIWESGVVDLGPLRSAIRDDVEAFAGVTRSPLYYLVPDAADGSAEGAAMKREGLMFKARDRITTTSEYWELVLSIAFEVVGDETRANRSDMECLWLPPERFSMLERFQSAQMAQAAGIPWQTAMVDIGYTQTEVARMAAQRASDLLFTAPTPAAPEPDLPVA